MGNKILKITEKQPVETSLPDGIYTGKWRGYFIDVKYGETNYELTTESGVTGDSYVFVIVFIKDGEATFDILNN